MNRNLGTRGGRGSRATAVGRIRMRNRGRSTNGEAGTGARRGMSDLMAIG